MDERRQVDACHRGGVMPEIESRIDLEQMQAAAIVPLEIHLRGAAHVQRGENVAAQIRDVRQVDDLDRRAVAVVRWERADLGPGELAREITACVDVRVEALNRALGPGDESLDEQLRAKRGQPRPDRVPVILRATRKAFPSSPVAVQSPPR